MTDTIAADIEKVPDTMTPGPVTEHLSLRSGFGILGRGNMVNHGFDPRRIKHPVLAPGDQIIDRNGGGDFMAEHGVQPNYINTVGRLIHPVCVEYFFSNCFTHLRFSPVVGIHFGMQAAAGQRSACL